ncbi:MAG TPA: L-lactate permease [Terriglobales bacterium]|jgi:lactate permease|nr:L-lactate permease [Terriglobales bacterium]
MTWTQTYDPFGHWWLSTLCAALPIVVLFVLLAGLRVRPHLAALAGVATAIVVATTAFHMPVSLASASFLYGVSFGMLKIVWIVVAAVFLYDVSVEAGKFEIMQRSIARITDDQRLQVLLVAFCFGAFIEGCAGFGSPVAIAGAFMIGLGFRPFHAAALNLIANTAPVAWGAIGTPVHTLAAVCGLPEADLSAMIGRILPITAVIVPFWLVRVMVGWELTFEVLPAILAVGFSFGLTQFFWANHMDSNLVDIASGVVSMIVLVVFLKFWRPKRVWRDGQVTTASAKSVRRMSKQEEAVISRDSVVDPPPEPGPSSTATRKDVAMAWLPFLILSVIVLLWGLPTVKTAINRHTTPAFERGGWEFPILHNHILRAAPVVAKPTREAAKFDFNWLSATGSGCFLAAIISGLILGLGPRRLLRVFGHTLYRMRFAILAISFMLGLGYVTRYSGLDAVLGLAFTRSGKFYPFFGTFLGWLGVALTGSDTSSNALFGSLQRITSQQLGLDPVLMCAANSAGGVMGKMVDAQSICVATAATNQLGNEGQIFRFVVWHSIALGAIVGLIVLMYAYVFPHAVPHGLILGH